MNSPNVFAERRNGVAEEAALVVAGSLADARASQKDPGTPVPPSDSAPMLPIVAELFPALDAAGVRYGVVQDLASLPDALAGRDDLDVLLDKKDYPIFCAIVARLHGLRGVSLSCYDNVCAGREDWFIPDFSRSAYLHIDLHIGIRVGWEFRKRYLAFDYAGIGRWERSSMHGISIPILSPEDEVRLAVARFAFRLWTRPWTRWVAVPGCWKDQLSSLPMRSGEPGLHVVEYAGRHGTVSCRIRPSKDGFVVHCDDLARLRRSIRHRCGFSGGSSLADAVVHVMRKTSYVLLRLLARLLPGAIPAKRRPSAGGLVVALVAPDGLGKSTQVDLLTRIFRWKFGCEQAYAGTGDGQGWWFRKWLQQLVSHRQREFKAQIQRDCEEQRSGAKGKILAVGLALWGVLIAIERYAVVKRVHRWATRGLIVISDRWPQAQRTGYLDGPMILSSPSSVPGVAMLARLEQKLYRKMDECKPHLTLHLVSDFAVSQRRKPGEISKEGFEARLALMAELRALDKDIRSIDASGSAEAINRDLFKQIWLSL
ncbi:hypothetical protein IB238_13875 [Rhizobium sp. ARZ01]|uniref:hypothetical protein n=1 Tax=Rhizobium sp. ARZ01 TaxID=2769313 RepID=UPI001786545A|nr:hypothetical protein [Rhizobium sp. ARZ01]